MFIDTSATAKRKWRSRWKTSATFCRPTTNRLTTNFHSWFSTNSTATIASSTSWTTPHPATHSDTWLPAHSTTSSACSICSSTTISCTIAFCSSARYWPCALSIPAGASTSTCLSCGSGTSTSTSSQDLLLSCSSTYCQKWSNKNTIFMKIFVFYFYN